MKQSEVSICRSTSLSRNIFLLAAVCLLAVLLVFSAHNCLQLPARGLVPVASLSAAVCSRGHASGRSLDDVLQRAFSATPRKDTEWFIPLDEAEKNRRMKMGNTSLGNLSRSECRRASHDFTGVNQTGHKQSIRNLSPHLMQNGCPVHLLLIVIFNGDFHGNVPFIRSLYETAFSKVVFYSQSGSKEHGVRASPKLWNGYKQHIAIAQAMMEFPGYDGYWWIGDDVLLNYPYLFATMDMKKVWTTRREEVKGRAFPGVGKKFADNTWMHWNTGYGMEAVQKLYSCLRPVYVQRMPAAFACSHCVVYMGSDVGYIPAGYVEEFLELAYVFREVLHEITLPTILRLMVADVDQHVFEDWTNHIYLWAGTGLQKFQEVERLWTATSTFAHPIKFSATVPGSRSFATQKLKEGLTRYGKEFILLSAAT